MPWPHFPFPCIDFFGVFYLLVKNTLAATQSSVKAEVLEKTVEQDAVLL
jgi:hypothetical protein